MIGRADPSAEQARAEMVRELRDYGITDERVLEAMARVPRHRFVPEASIRQAYADSPVRIAEGQTMSQPYIVAVMTQSLQVRPGDHVLEIGCGSGYGAAVLGELAESVVSVERLAGLADTAAAVLEELGYDNVAVVVDDGSVGAADDAPFDGISVTAGAPEIPESLVDQLRIGGRMVVPVGPHARQELVVVTRTEDGRDVERLGPVAFVPLVGEEGWSGSRP